MKIAHIMRVNIILFSVVVIIGCTTENSGGVKMLKNVTAATPVSYIHEETPTIKTIEKLEGTWETFNSGTKSKWFFKDKKLYKNIIYSFGEAGEPKLLKIDFKKDCSGEYDEFGNSFTVETNRKHTQYTICYTILKFSEQELILKSEHGQRFTLKKIN